MLRSRPPKPRSAPSRRQSPTAHEGRPGLPNAAATSGHDRAPHELLRFVAGRQSPTQQSQRDRADRPATAPAAAPRAPHPISRKEFPALHAASSTMSEVTWRTVAAKTPATAATKTTLPRAGAGSDSDEVLTKAIAHPTSTAQAKMMPDPKSEKSTRLWNGMTASATASSGRSGHSLQSSRHSARPAKTTANRPIGPSSASHSRGSEWAWRGRLPTSKGTAWAACAKPPMPTPAAGAVDHTQIAVRQLSRRSCTGSSSITSPRPAITATSTGTSTKAAKSNNRFFRPSCQHAARAEGERGPDR